MIASPSGTSAGIGTATAQIFASKGYNLILTGRREERLIDLKKELEEKFNIKVIVKSFDVRIESDVREAFDSLSEDVKVNIKILINNAGIAQIGNVEDTSSGDFQKIFDVNVKGAFNCIKAVIPTMVKNRSGVILNMASVASSVGIPDRFGYSMTKGAIKSMTQSIAKDYISKGIRCNCISPARVHTPFVDGFIQKNYPNNQKEMFEKLSASQPIGRMAKPIEIAHLALYLCSDEASFATGCDYPLDGGFLHLNN